MGRWRIGDFELLWGGQTIRYLGNEITRLALPVMAIVGLGATTAEVGILGALVYLPFLVIGLPAGVWATGRDRRRLLILADLGRSGIILALLLAFATGVVTLAILWVAALGIGCFAVMFEVAFAAYPPSLVPRTRLLGANARLEASGSAARLIGPAIGGAVLASIGIVGALLLDAVTFLVSVASILGIRTREHSERTPAQGSLGQLLDGLRYVRRDAVLWPLIIAAAVFAILDAATWTVLPLVLLRDLGHSPLDLGVVLGFAGGGLVAGNALAGRLSSKHRAHLLLVAGAGLAVAGHLVMAMAAAWNALPLLTGAALAAGIGEGAFAVPYITLRQVTPPALLTRVAAIFRASVWGAIPAGGLLVAALGPALSPTAILAVASALIVLCLVPLASAGLKEADARLAAATKPSGTSLAQDQAVVP